MPFFSEPIMALSGVPYRLTFQPGKPSMATSGYGQNWESESKSIWHWCDWCGKPKGERHNPV